MEDVKFHQCVRLARFESDRTISFIPPDGEFELMSYRISTPVKPLVWVEAAVEAHRGSRVEYLVKVKGQFKRRSTANNVEIFVPVPDNAESPKFRVRRARVCGWRERSRAAGVHGHHPVRSQSRDVDERALALRAVDVLLFGHWRSRSSPTLSSKHVWILSRESESRPAISASPNLPSCAVPGNELIAYLGVRLFFTTVVDRVSLSHSPLNNTSHHNVSQHLLFPASRSGGSAAAFVRPRRSRFRLPRGRRSAASTSGTRLPGSISNSSWSFRATARIAAAGR
jgi:hypothetical protein